jgi:peptidoglycan/LPS O-acetylase OafA/YrhL
MAYMDYRREIDGLRALAVLPVILFHAGFQTFSGGFVGVDIFFVISGYLITSIILAEMEAGTFTLANFYERRARRILPALFFVMLVCLPFAWFLLLPSEMKDFSKSLIAVSAFASNILFWRTSAYFDTAAELKPLLHTWSLAVEEQYYVLFPLFLMLFWKLGKRGILLTLGLVFISSFALAQWAAYAKPAAAFFLLPTRSWEFIVGAFAAFYISQANRKNFPRNLSELSSWLGVALIFFSVFTYTKATPFPGVYALVPTLGTVLIILFATQQTSVGKILGNKAFVGIGLISYSAYLWHQPLLSFARHKGVTSYDKEVLFLLITAIIVLAYLSWKFIEAPFRNKSVVSKKSIFVFAFLGSLIFALFGSYAINKNGDLGKWTIEQKRFLDYFENDLPEWRYTIKKGLLEANRIDCDFYDIPLSRTGKSTNVPVENISNNCFTKQLEQSKVVFIWGDSHAQQLNYGLSKLLPAEYEVLQVASSGCIIDLRTFRNKVNYCEYSNWFAYDTVKKLKPDLVIIGQNLGHDSNRMNEIALELKSNGVKKVIFTGPSPHWAPTLPAVVTRLLPFVPNRTFYGVDKSVLELDKKLKLANLNSINFDYISLIDYFCNGDGCLLHFESDIAESVTSHDYGHLTPIASYHFAKDVLVPFIVR